MHVRVCAEQKVLLLLQLEIFEPSYSWLLLLPFRPGSLPSHSLPPLALRPLHSLLRLATKQRQRHILFIFRTLDRPDRNEPCQDKTTHRDLAVRDSKTRKLRHERLSGQARASADRPDTHTHTYETSNTHTLSTSLAALPSRLLLLLLRLRSSLYCVPYSIQTRQKLPVPCQRHRVSTHSPEPRRRCSRDHLNLPSIGSRQSSVRYPQREDPSRL